MFFSDLHIQLLSRGILNPGEQLVGQTVTSYNPWWAFGLIRRQYLVLATDQRAILVDHRYSFFRPMVQRLHQVESIQWGNCTELRVKGIFKKKLSVKGMSDHGNVNLKMPIPNTFFGLLAPMANNRAGAQAVASAFAGAQVTPSLAPAPNAYAPQLPAPAAAPQYSQAPQAPQQQYSQPPQPQAQYGQPQQHYSQPPQQAYAQPQVNAPGYASVPPAAPQGQYGVAPAPIAQHQYPRSYS